MKAFFWGLIFLFCTWSLFFIGKGVDNLDIMAERYKRALDAGANAASSYKAYSTGRLLREQGTGYGEGQEDSTSVPIDREESLRWFYRIFFRNLGIEDKNKQNELKKHIPMKAVILYDRLMIADADDEWSTYDSSGEREYIICYRGEDYKFTLSDQIYDIERGKWIAAGDIGITPEERKAMLTQYVINELDSFINNRRNRESGNSYRVVFSLEDTEDRKLSGISGVNFVVFCEGIPLPSLNPFRRNELYAYGIGGSEIRRESR